jgi:hypothetical protein
MRSRKFLGPLVALAWLALLVAAVGPVSAQTTLEDLEERHPWRGGAFRHLRELKLKEKAAVKRGSSPESEDPEAAGLARRCLFGKKGQVRYTRDEIVFSVSGEKIAGHKGIKTAAGSTAAVDVLHAGEGSVDQVVHFVLAPGYDPQRNAGYAYLARENAWGVARLGRSFQWKIPSGYPPGIHALHACTALRDGVLLRSRLIIRVSDPQ